MGMYVCILAVHFTWLFFLWQYEMKIFFTEEMRGEVRHIPISNISVHVFMINQITQFVDKQYFALQV